MKLAYLLTTFCLAAYAIAPPHVQSADRGQSHVSAEIEGVIRRLFHAIVTTNAAALRSLIDDHVLVIEGGPAEALSSIHSARGKLEELLDHRGSLTGVTVTDVRSERSPATPSVAIAHFDLRLPLDEERIAQEREALQYISDEDTYTVAAVQAAIQEGAARIPSTAILVRQGESWRVTALIVPL